MKGKLFRIPLRVVFYQEDGVWIAHCLEFDLAGDGETKQAALNSLETAIQIQLDESIAHDNPSNLFNPADSELFAKFAAGQDVVSGTMFLRLERSRVDHVEIGDVQMREYAGAVAQLG
jgi:predicted RNase H-like HicB family nuclease